jgi:hypothetical protein
MKNKKILSIFFLCVFLTVPNFVKAEIIFEDNFILPYLKKEVKKDFDVDIKHTTHAKMIIKNTKFSR